MAQLSVVEWAHIFPVLAKFLFRKVLILVKGSKLLTAINTNGNIIQLTHRLA